MDLFVIGEHSLEFEHEPASLDAECLLELHTCKPERENPGDCANHRGEICAILKIHSLENPHRASLDELDLQASFGLRDELRNLGLDCLHVLPTAGIHALFRARVEPELEFPLIVR